MGLFLLFFLEGFKKLMLFIFYRCVLKNGAVFFTEGFKKLMFFYRGVF